MKRFFTCLALVCLTSLLFAAAPPTVPGSGLSFTDIDGTRLSLRFTSGNGSQRIVVVKEGSPVTGLPQNGRDYTGNSNFGTAGTEFGPEGEYVVASRSSWNSFTVQNLKPGTVYHIAVFENNGSGTTAEYLTLPLTGSQMTAVAPTLQAAFNTSTKTGNSVTLNLTRGNGNGRLVIARKGSPVNAAPTDLSFYSYDENFGAGAKMNTDNYVVYRGVGTAVTVKQLEPNTTYHFAVFEYNGNNSPVYFQPGGSYSIVTNAGPGTASSNIGLSYVEGNSFRISCTRGNGSHRLFIMSKNGPVTSVPVNGQVYTANRAFGTAGTEIAEGEYVVGGLTGNTVDVTNLEGNTIYYFRIFDYDVDAAGNTYYLTSSSAISSGSSALIPTIIGSNLKITNLTGTSASIGLTHGNGTMRMVIAKEESPVDAVPADYTTYSGNNNFGSGAQITSGNYVTHKAINGNPFTINNLKPGFTYHVAIYEFNGSNAPMYSRSAATISFTIPVEPTNCSTAPWSTFIEGSSLRFIWTNGNGARRIVVARKNADVTAAPADGVNYIANAKFGQGDVLEDGQFVVYNGTGTNVDLESLEIGATYHFAVYEYNVGANNNPDYLTSCSLKGSASTATTPAVQTTIIGATNIQATQVTINFTKGNGASRLILMRENEPVNKLPQDYSKYTYNSGFGLGNNLGDGNYVVLISGGTGNFTVTGLKPLTTYHISAFEFNGSATPAYLRDISAVYNFTTPDVPEASTPTTSSSNPSFTSVDGNKFTFKWTNGNGEKRIVVMKKDEAPGFVPASATNYTANSEFGKGTDLGGGEYVVYNGSVGSVEISNLEHSSTYYLKVFEYNGTVSLIRYLTASPLSTNGATFSAPATASFDVRTTVGNNSVSFSWEKGNGTGRILVMRQGSAIQSTPAGYSVYPANAAFGAGSQIAAGEYLVYAGTGNSVTVTGLTEDTYHYSLFEYNGSAAPVYNIAQPAIGSVTVGATLPVTLTYFTAEERTGSILLKWATAQEINNAYFDVERSVDGNAFTKIATIQGAGNSNENLDYQFTDFNITSSGKIQYRLKQVDIDGKFEYSKIVTVRYSVANRAINIYPNPARDQLNILLTADMNQARLNVVNTAGVNMYTLQVKRQAQIDVSRWPNGVYFIVVQSGNEKIQTRIVKQ